MRTMYDSITAADIPAGAQLVAGYVSGTWAWSAADWARFPRAVQVRIATQANVDAGQVLDVEIGDATPAQAPGWVVKRRSVGVDPTVYCSASAWPTVRAAFAAAHVAEPHYWIAHYDNVADLPVDAVAKQYADPVTSGGHFDLSAVADHWPGIDPAATTQEDVMPLTDKITVTNGPDTLGEMTVGQALGRIAYELTARLPTRATINADPKNADTLLGRATSADGHAYDNAQRLGALAARVDTLSAQQGALIAAVAAATKDPAITEDRLRTVFREELVAQVQITGTVDIHSATPVSAPAPAPTPAPAAPTAPTV